MNHQTVLLAVRNLYASIEQFDAKTAYHMDMDRTALRAVNALEHRQLSPAELASILSLTSGSVTALLDRLEKDGHIERTKSKEDGRRSEVKLSKKTRSKAHSYYNRLGETISTEFASKDSKELEQIVLTLNSLAHCFENGGSGS
jgi:DNA-binding MarR family transcriptional regulator